MQRIQDVILFQIDQTNKVARQHAQKEFDRLGLGITVEQWIILKIISEADGLSQTELAARSFRDPASITRTLDLLEKKHFIEREAIPNNRRAYNITLTAAGKQCIKDNMKLVRSQRERSIKGLSEKELHTLSTILKKIRQNMS